MISALIHGNNFVTRASKAGRDIRNCCLNSRSFFSLYIVLYMVECLDRERLMVRSSNSLRTSRTCSDQKRQLHPGSCGVLIYYSCKTGRKYCVVFKSYLLCLKVEFSLELGLLNLGWTCLLHPPLWTATNWKGRLLSHGLPPSDSEIRLCIRDVMDESNQGGRRIRSLQHASFA